MKTVRGHFDGNVVVLDEPAPLSDPADVVVQFPGHSTGPAEPVGAGEIEAMPASGPPAAPGLPPLPTPEEWRARMADLRRALNEWCADESGYDEEAWPELKEGLDRNRAESGAYRKLFP